MNSSWKVVKLEEILSQDQNSAVKVKPTKIYNMVGVYSFGNGLFIKNSIEGFNTSYKKFYRLKEDHIVLSQLFGWEGAIALSNKKFVGKFVSSQFPTFLINKEKAELFFVSYFGLSLKSALFNLRSRSLVSC